MTSQHLRSPTEPRASSPILPLHLGLYPPPPGTRRGFLGPHRGLCLCSSEGLLVNRGQCRWSGALRPPLREPHPLPGSCSGNISQLSVCSWLPVPSRSAFSLQPSLRLPSLPFPPCSFPPSFILHFFLFPLSPHPLPWSRERSLPENSWNPSRTDVPGPASVEGLCSMSV